MPTSYVRRVVDDELDELLPALPALALEGPKGVGKTATARRRAQTVHALDAPGARELFEADPSRLLRGKPPVLLDEWQRVPVSWDLVRRAVDDDPAPGRFLLAGSAATIAGSTHSGAGRIVRLRMRPMTLAERGIATPTISLSGLLRGQRPRLEGATAVTVEVYADEICRSGFPAIRTFADRALRSQLDGYLDRILDRDLDEEVDRPIRTANALRRWMSAYAAATGTTAAYDVIRDAATPGERDKPAKATALAYREALERLWILDPLPAWLPTASHLRRLGASPRHHLVDPALAARLLGVQADALLDAARGSFTPRDGTLLGQLFESLVSLDVRVYAQAAEARVGHLRTHGGEHEVDLIVERSDHRVLAIEVKLARTVRDGDVRHLRWLQDQLGDDVVDAIVITTGGEAYRRADGIGVVPAAVLGP